MNLIKLNIKDRAKKKNINKTFFSRSGESETSVWKQKRKQKKKRKNVSKTFEQNIENDIIDIDYE